MRVISYVAMVFFCLASSVSAHPGPGKHHHRPAQPDDPGVDLQRSARYSSSADALIDRAMKRSRQMIGIDRIRDRCASKALFGLRAVGVTSRRLHQNLLTDLAAQKRRRLMVRQATLYVRALTLFDGLKRCRARSIQPVVGTQVTVTIDPSIPLADPTEASYWTRSGRRR